MIAIVVWMVGLELHFGIGVLPLLLVLATIVLVAKRMFRRRFLN